MFLTFLIVVLLAALIAFIETWVVCFIWNSLIVVWLGAPAISM